MQFYTMLQKGLDVCRLGESDTQGGAGAYFIVNWLALKPVNEPLIQAIMLSTASSLGFSFKTEGIKLNKQQ